MNLKRKTFNISCTNLLKRKEVPYMEMSRDIDQKRKEYPYMEVSRDTGAYKSRDLHLSNHCSTFFLKSQLASSATSILSCSPMAYNTTQTLEKLACTDCLDFGKCQDRFGRFSWSKKDSNYLDINLKVFKREDKNAEFRLRQNLSMGEADFNQFIRQRNQLGVVENKICRQFFNLHCPKTWRSNWSLFTKWFTLWIAQTEGFVWHCWNTRWTTQKVPMLKFIYSDGRSRMKKFSKSLCQV